MGLNRRLYLEGDPTKANLNSIFAEIANRLIALEGKSDDNTRDQPITCSVSKGTQASFGNFTVNRYGDDLEKVALAAGATMDVSGQWIATQTIATIIEMDTTKNIKYYYDTGLTPNVPYNPTLELTTAL